MIRSCLYSSCGNIPNNSFKGAWITNAEDKINIELLITIICWSFGQEYKIVYYCEVQYMLITFNKIKLCIDLKENQKGKYIFIMFSFEFLKKSQVWFKIEILTSWFCFMFA